MEFINELLMKLSAIFQGLNIEPSTESFLGEFPTLLQSNASFLQMMSKVLDFGFRIASTIVKEMLISIILIPPPFGNGVHDLPVLILPSQSSLC